jgi:hypothetical protein
MYWKLDLDWVRETLNQGCQIFLGPNIPKWEKYTYQMATNYTKRPQIIPNGHKIYQHFPIEGPLKFTQIVIFGLKTNHLATLLWTCRLRKKESLPSVKWMMSHARSDFFLLSESLSLRHIITPPPKINNKRTLLYTSTGMMSHARSDFFLDTMSWRDTISGPTTPQTKTMLLCRPRRQGYVVKTFV